MFALFKPFNELSLINRNFDDLFHGFEGNGHRVDFAPAVDIEETKESLLIHADLPGVNEKDIEVKVHDGTLLISGKREFAVEEKKENSVYRERSSGSFCRQFTLGRNVDTTKIEAAFKNGVLTVVLPKKEEAKPKQIPISTN